MSQDTERTSAGEIPSAMLDQAKELLLESGNCAQTSFAILNEEHKLDGQQILKALTPFPGIALRGETCGAVIGSLMALGLVYGREDLTDWKGYIGSLQAIVSELGRDRSLYNFLRSILDLAIMPPCSSSIWDSNRAISSGLRSGSISEIL